MRPSGTLAWLALCWPLALAAGGVERIHTSGFGAHACGNGVVEEAEQCDDGDADEGDGCTTSCRVGAACDAAAFPGADRFAVDPASGHCYAAHEDEALPFDGASAACTARGAHLASLATA
jgi:cysteine-rich repeat protein